MEPDQLLAFIGLSVVVAVVPGPDMALVARNVLRYGRTAGFATSLGICTGILGWALAAGIGISAILATSATAFTILKIAGAAYLIYLGLATFRGSGAAIDGGPERGRKVTLQRAWAQGLLSALLNPKLGVFFLTMLPQFVEPGSAYPLQLVQLALVFDLIGLAWLLTYSAMLAAVGSALSRPAARRLLQRLTGALLIGLGARVALDRS